MINEKYWLVNAGCTGFIPGLSQTGVEDKPWDVMGVQILR
jgi:hypothetical protein